MVGWQALVAYPSSQPTLIRHAAEASVIRTWDGERRESGWQHQQLGAPDWLYPERVAGYGVGFKGTQPLYVALLDYCPGNNFGYFTFPDFGANYRCISGLATGGGDGPATTQRQPRSPSQAGIWNYTC